MIMCNCELKELPIEESLYKRQKNTLGFFYKLIELLDGQPRRRCNIY